MKGHQQFLALLGIKIWKRSATKIRFWSDTSWHKDNCKAEPSDDVAHHASTNEVAEV